MSTDTDTRAQIMDAFGEQFSATGYPGISLLGVARTVGIRKPSIYHHFPGGKEDLYAAVAVRFIETTHERITEALAEGETFEDRLKALVRVSVEHTGATVSFEQRVYDALDLVSDETRERVSGLYVGQVLDPVVTLFTEAVEDGHVEGDPHFLTNAFLHLARGASLENAGATVDLFLNGARAR